MTLKRTILITGATDGLGGRTAEKLASADVLLLIHGRDARRGREIVEAIEAAGGSASFYQADFASLLSVRRMADAIAHTYDRLDVIINNAGVTSTQGQRRLSEDGYELHFAVNYLAGFLLTQLLRPCLCAQRASLVINVASAVQAPIDFENVMLEHGYDWHRAYGQSKLADIMFARDLSEELEPYNVTSVSLHPSSYMDTRMVRAAGITPTTSVDVGAQAILALVNGAGSAISGHYFNGMHQARAHPQAYDVEARQMLRQLSLELTGLDAVVGGGGHRPARSVRTRWKHA